MSFVSFDHGRQKLFHGKEMRKKVDIYRCSKFLFTLREYCLREADASVIDQHRWFAKSGTDFGRYFVNIGGGCYIAFEKGYI